MAAFALCQVPVVVPINSDASLPRSVFKLGRDKEFHLLSFEDAKEPLLHLYKNKEPYTATIFSVERLVGPKAPGETCYIVIDHDGNVPYWEGQSYGVIPPDENPKSLAVLRMLGYIQ